MYCIDIWDCGCGKCLFNGSFCLMKLDMSGVIVLVNVALMFAIQVYPVVPLISFFVHFSYLYCVFIFSLLLFIILTSVLVICMAGPEHSFLVFKCLVSLPNDHLTVWPPKLLYSKHA